MEELEPKRPGQSYSMMTDVVFPEDTNYHGTAFGGMIMRCMDKIATVAAMRHAAGGVVTASAGPIEFYKPLRAGQAIELTSKVVWSSKSSMEIDVRVTGEDFESGERFPTASGVFIFVAVDHEGKPRAVAPIKAETDEERRRFEEAQVRYLERKAKK
ncbi:acyl-CoA thioesterase [Paenibacillus turpanensis]|uniref:acyl-CoA thioesterase n=1 Tax=Paenibacillus turpanensis TaxID=2689078 RepID=UPI0014086459|nr:acyl-CoA thioesterase [Paenibacillus turpanensis]